MKQTKEKKDVNPKEPNINSVIPTQPVEEHPLFFSAKLNDKYYLSAFGQIVLILVCVEVSVGVVKCPCIYTIMNGLNPCLCGS